KLNPTRKNERALQHAIIAAPKQPQHDGSDQRGTRVYQTCGPNDRERRKQQHQAAKPDDQPARPRLHHFEGRGKPGRHAKREMCKKYVSETELELLLDVEAFGVKFWLIPQSETYQNPTPRENIHTENDNPRA